MRCCHSWKGCARTGARCSIGLCLKQLSDSCARLKRFPRTISTTFWLVCCAFLSRPTTVHPPMRNLWLQQTRYFWTSRRPREVSEISSARRSLACRPRPRRKGAVFYEACAAREDRRGESPTLDGGGVRLISRCGPTRLVPTSLATGDHHGQVFPGLDSWRSGDRSRCCVFVLSLKRKARRTSRPRRDGSYHSPEPAKAFTLRAGLARSAAA